MTKKAAPKEENPMKAVNDKVTKEMAEAGIEIPTRRARMLMVNPADFMFLFTQGLEFRKHTKLVQGIPADARLLAVAAEPVRHAIMLVVESDEYDEVPINVMPPVQLIEIQTGKPDATKKKKVARKKR